MCSTATGIVGYWTISQSIDKYYCVVCCVALQGLNQRGKTGCLCVFAWHLIVGHATIMSKLRYAPELLCCWLHNTIQWYDTFWRHARMYIKPATVHRWKTQDGMLEQLSQQQNVIAGGDRLTKYVILCLLHFTIMFLFCFWLLENKYIIKMIYEM